MIPRPLTLLLLAALNPAPAGGVPAIAEPVLEPVLEPVSARVSTGAAAHRRDPLRLLGDWIRRVARSRSEPDGQELARIDQLISEASALVRLTPQRASELDLAFLDLAALESRAERESDERGPLPEPAAGSAEGPAGIRDLAQLGRRHLEARLDREPDDVGPWLALQVLESPDQPTTRRVAVAELLAGRYLAATRAALLRTAHRAAGELREAALLALTGWPDPIVHEFFLDLLTPEGHGLWALGRHLELTRGTMERRSLDRVRDEAGRLLLSEDWRSAARAMHLMRALDADRAVPVLMEGLRWWIRMGQEGRGSKRIAWDVVAQLRRISGRSIGLSPTHWSTWWDAVQSGRFSLPGGEGDDPTRRTVAGFFGLNPRTDRVLFLLDKSGSMADAFGTGGSSSYDEAVDQLLRFLKQAGPRTRFSIVLFSDRGDRWRSSLTLATEPNLDRAGTWLRQNSPGGGTELFEGLRTALRLDRQGRLQIDRIDVDTVIVLCDGETAEGPGWVAPWLEAWNEQAQLVFQCVQIGDAGNGTLEALAEGSGGRFVRVRR